MAPPLPLFDWLEPDELAVVLPCRFDALMRGVRFELLPRLVVLWSLLSCFPAAMRLCSTPHPLP